MYLLAPVNGTTAGAVFVGKRAYTLTPAADDEARQLRIETGDEKLTTLADTFESAVFFDAPLVKAAGVPKQATVAPRSSTSAIRARAAFGTWPTRRASTRAAAR